MYNYTITILIVLLNPNQIEMIRRIAAKPSCRLQAADHWDRLTVHTVHCTVHTPVITVASGRLCIIAYVLNLRLIHGNRYIEKAPSVRKSTKEHIIRAL